MTKTLLHSSNATGQLINCNRAWLDAMGYTREEALELSRRDYCTPESLKRVEAFFVPTATAQGELNDVPFEFVTKSGDILHVICTVMVFYDPDGNVNHYVVASRPVEENVHRELSELRDQLDAARKVLATNIRAASDLLAKLRA